MIDGPCPAMPSMLISPEYIEKLCQAHSDRSDFGKRGNDWVPYVNMLCVYLKSSDVLDYGCGKGELNLHMPFELKQYDPAIPKYREPPEPADLVVCTDVLEHVEPDKLQAVLNDLRRVTKRLLFLHIPTVPATKTFADGTNVHLIVENEQWWMDKLLFAGWKVFEGPNAALNKDGEAVSFTVVLEP